MDFVYIVIIEDRHSDVEVRAFKTAPEAMACAYDLACKYKHKDEPPIRNELTSDMIQAKWLAYYKYSCEGDCTRVVCQVLR